MRAPNQHNRSLKSFSIVLKKDVPSFHTILKACKTERDSIERRQPCATSSFCGHYATTSRRRSWRGRSARRSSSSSWPSTTLLSVGAWATLTSFRSGWTRRRASRIWGIRSRSRRGAAGSVF
ncbi:hypothetical protein BJ166DRAFT_623415 [Pestalotiopsis sp. NC0098]|nr:hypothetical protein BJ166DRAFT_623415 [Pestalotiopsis sp. NC0098]